MEALTTAALVAVLLLSAWVGWWIRRRLDERHLAGETVDSVRLLMGMLLTFAALVLGLLVSNAKQRFDGLSDQLSGFATDLIELDGSLRAYGPAEAETRTILRAYTAAAIASTWPGEGSPVGDYPRAVSHGTEIEGLGLGDMLRTVALRIERLEPSTPVQSAVAAQLRRRIDRVADARWQLIFASGSTISWPFLLTLASWLAIIFAIFGMTTTPSRLMVIVVALTAASIASPVYLILDYGSALSGGITLSSMPLRAALQHMDRP